jgi:hypothetical protein
MSETKGQTTGASSLRSALAAVCEEDLLILRQEIEELGRQIAGLRELEKIVDRRLHGHPVREAAAKGAHAGKLGERIRDAILQNGPGTVRDLALKLNVKEQAIRIAMGRAPDSFRLDGNKWSVRLTD